MTPRSLALQETRAARPVRRRRRWRATHRFWNLLTLVVGLWLLVGFAQGLVKMALLHAHIDRLEKQMAVVDAEKRRLEARVKEMSSDAYIEKVAREELGLAKPGETLYVPTKSTDPDDPYLVRRREGASSQSGGGEY